MASSLGAQMFLPVVLQLLILVKVCGSEDTWTTFDYEDEQNTSSSTIDYSQYALECQKGDVRSFRAWFLPIIYTIICLVGFIGNMMVILTYIYFNRLKTMTDIYLLNLAIADILFVLTLPFWASSYIIGWVFGSGSCKMVFCIYKLSFFSGMLLLMCISVDRYYAIAHATSAHGRRSKVIYYSKVSSICLWIMAFLFAMPDLVHSGVQQRNNVNICMHTSENLVNLKVWLHVGQITVGFMLPLLVMCFCYFVIIQTLLQARNFEKNKAIKVIFAVVLIFLAFQLPYNGVMLMRTISMSYKNNTNCEYEKKMDIAEDITKSLAFLRCCLNPILYAFIGVKFRNDLVRLLKEIGCISQQQLFRYTSCKQKRSSLAMDTDTTTTFAV
ncbi:C-C chemokine receptor type 7 [Polypterus senegalus]|uniref:C-C chemokine receptor type 7 n=1 Tax=Polypterus senegalus TaxID=55291 RepID=UPI0019623EB4|nr:C-C chemokine receptor type 7 [Polypterus senegalus]